MLTRILTGFPYGLAHCSGNVDSTDATTKSRKVGHLEL